jgi:hypothetical protein
LTSALRWWRKERGSAIGRLTPSSGAIIRRRLSRWSNAGRN